MIARVALGADMKFQLRRST